MHNILQFYWKTIFLKEVMYKFMWSYWNDEDDGRRTKWVGENERKF